MASRPPVFAGVTAGVIWGLPHVGRLSERVEVLMDEATGGRSTSSVRRRDFGWPSELETVDGLTTTTLARTVIDISRWDSFLNGVVAADAALHGLELGPQTVTLAPSSLLDATHEALPVRGSGKIRQVLEFADGASASPGESLSRVNMRRLRLPAPELQVRFEDGDGEMFVDFCWPWLQLIGEFDGAGKYTREQMTQGRSVAEVVLDEKRREDRLRALGWRVVRWGWDDALRPERLRSILWQAGLRPVP